MFSMSSLASLQVACCAIAGEASLSYGYESSGKICASSNFADYADPFGEGDIIGVYLVSMSCLVCNTAAGVPAIDLIAMCSKI